MREAREAAKMSRFALAIHLNVTERTIVRYEAGETQPDGSTVDAIAKVLRIKRQRLMEA